jgi:uncharacterized protein (DUF1501 family)
MCTHKTDRRTALAGIFGGLTALAAPRVWAQAAPGKSASDGRVVVVLLRGAVDGLSVLAPHADPEYVKLRPNIHIPAPDGTDNTALALDARFGLHPALKSLMPMWAQGSLGFVAAAGLPKPNRSHFDAQAQLELGGATRAGADPQGWMNRVSASLSKYPASLGVGESNPLILSGAAEVKLIPRGQAAARSGVLANAQQRDALLDLYAGDDDIAKAFRQGAGSRSKSASELLADKRERGVMPAPMSAGTPAANTMNTMNTMTASQQAVMTAASNGAPDAFGFALDAQHLATLMRTDPNLRMGFLSAGGWDTHANQGAVQGQLANNLRNLAEGLVALRAQFNRPNDTIVVMSEFGRTTAENGTRGTDHGFGNTMWLIGNRVAGGKIHGEWTGLANANLNESRDTPAHHDFRSVLAPVLRASLGLTDSQTAQALPGGMDDKRLAGLIRAA